MMDPWRGEAAGGTMRFKAISTLLILVPLVCVLTGCGGATAKERIATDRPWEALPEGVIGAGWVDVRGLMASAIGKDIQRSTLASQGDMVEFNHFVDSTGFDPTEDLESITIGFGQQVGETRAPLYVIASGDFDVDRLAQALQEEEATPPREIDGMMTYVLKGNADSDAARVGWLNEKTMLFSSDADFSTLIQSARSPQNSEASKTLSRLMDDADGQLFMALEIPDAMREQIKASTSEPGGNPLFSMMGPMSSLHTVLLSMDTVAGLDLALTAVTGSAEDGQLLHDSLAGLMAMARMASGGDAETLERLNQLQLSVDGPKLNVSMKMTEEQLASALADVEGTEED